MRSWAYLAAVLAVMLAGLLVPWASPVALLVLAGAVLVSLWPGLMSR